MRHGILLDNKSAKCVNDFFPSDMTASKQYIVENFWQKSCCMAYDNNILYKMISFSLARDEKIERCWWEFENFLRGCKNIFLSL